MEGAGLPPSTVRGAGKRRGKRWGLFAEEGAVVGEGLAGEEGAVGRAEGKEERAFGRAGRSPVAEVACSRKVLRSLAVGSLR